MKNNDIAHHALQEVEHGVLSFLKNWTLPAAMLTGTVVYLVFAFVPQLDSFGNVAGPIFDEILPAFMFMILFVTFCKVDFRKLIPVAWHWWVALLQTVFIFIVVGSILAFDIKGNNLILMEALLVCIISPCAAAAPVVTQKLGGDIEQMTTYTFLTNFITAALVPICFPLIDKDVDMTFMQAFLLILYKVCIVLVLPMLLAYIVKHHMHRLHRWILSVKDLSFYTWAVSLSIVSGATVKNIVHADTSLMFLLLIAMLGLLLCIVQYAIGRYVGHFFGTTIESGQGLGQKNTAFAVWMAYTYLNPVSSVGPGCYILWQNSINSIELWLHRRQKQE